MFLIWLGLVWALINLLARRYPLRSARTSLTLTSPLSLHISTTRFNSLPARLLDFLAKPEAYWKDQGRRWSTFWDVGALIGVGGVVVSQGVLLWAAARAVRVAWEVWAAGGDAGEAAVGLVKRGFTQTATGGSHGDPSSGLVLQAVVSHSSSQPSNPRRHSSVPQLTPHPTRVSRSLASPPPSPPSHPSSSPCSFLNHSTNSATPSPPRPSRSRSSLPACTSTSSCRRRTSPCPRPSPARTAP